MGDWSQVESRRYSMHVAMSRMQLVIPLEVAAEENKGSHKCSWISALTLRYCFVFDDERSSHELRHHCAGACCVREVGDASVCMLSSALRAHGQRRIFAIPPRD